MKIRIFLIAITLLTLAATCDYYDNRLQIKNNSSETITVVFSEDTLLPAGKNKIITLLLKDKIESGKTVRKNKPGSKNAWPFLIKRSTNQKLNIFFINADTLSKNNNWTNIKDNQAYERKEYTLNELENNNWLIVYP
ncbi:hypothetical protein EYV94_05640 [Puteibacter caeruleilacunae]|nr:hypothetical protein EYV94_05640 [Puteibacter caeruleilacunae]